MEKIAVCVGVLLLIMRLLLFQICFPNERGYSGPGVHHGVPHAARRTLSGECLPQ